ncbi:TolB family protein [Ferrimonas balearica]|uniref:TolB family protein n=1 Tax=Ferrimonas balearica TaxID=44012 RepID=UPI001C97ACFC|nr:hypothetical protein [Ferrimonas balearica]MBY6226229.1 hypothetical protein [Ferrimonas balearica]
MRPSTYTLPLLVTLSTLPLMAGATQLHLFSLKDGKITSHQTVTDAGGYNNQPAFTADSQGLLFSSDRAGGQMDIFHFDIAKTTLSNLTNTPEQSEFSPQPGQHGDEITYVVEQGVPHQSVWRQRLGQQPERAVNSYIPAGYYAQRYGQGTLLWARYGYHLYFEPWGEQADERHFVSASVGRSLHPIPNSAEFSFLHKQVDGDWVIKGFHPDSGAIRPITAIDKASEDYSWDQQGRIWMGNGSELRRWDAEGQWQSVADLSEHGVTTIGRLAVSPDGRYLAIVGL